MVLSDWIDLLGVILTFILTTIIIVQTQRLNKAQLEFETKVHQNEEDLQKRQIQINTFPYKREIYANVYGIFECCLFLKELSEKIDLNTKSGKALSDMFETICTGYIPDSKAVLWNLREAEFIFPKDIADVIIDIRTCFDKRGASLKCLGSIETILTDIELQSFFPDTKKTNIDEALSNCDANCNNKLNLDS